jgi:arabinose-5-phosphate isomerase
LVITSRNDGGLDRPVADVMTTTPLVVTLGSKMLEAVAIMARRKISELPVIDEQRMPIGMIDITDVVANFPEYALYAENTPEQGLPVTRLRVVA